jgi:hypothetical protein
MLGGVGGGVAEVVLLKVAEDGAGLEAIEVRQGIFGAVRDKGGEKGGDEEGGCKSSDGGHEWIKPW